MTLEHTPSWAVEQVWGSDRFYHEGDVASDQYAFVIDTGVALLDDLNVHTGWSRSFVNDEPDPHSLGAGHGTSVATVIGAKANGQGLTGVAPGAQIVALKALSDRGWGSGRDINEALEYARDVIVENDLFDKAVVNLSLGGGQPSRHPIVEEMAEMGIKITVAAGNSGRDVDGFSPASYGHHENVYTVSSNDAQGRYSNFTNFDGLDLNGIDDTDFAAPGSQVPTYNTDGTLRNNNGTSFSAPMVAGILLMSEKVRPGQVFEMSEDQVEKGMIPDPLAMFDPYTYKHGARPGDAPQDWYTPDPATIAPSRGEPVVIEKPVYIEVPVEVIVEKPVYIEVPGPERIIKVPVPTPAPQALLKGNRNAPNTIIGKSHGESIIGGRLRDKLHGAEGDDLLIGLKGDDVLWGGLGDDVLIGGGGRDKLIGGPGADTFILNKGFSKIKDYNPEEDVISYDGFPTFVERNGKTFVHDGSDAIAVLVGTFDQIVTI